METVVTSGTVSRQLNQKGITSYNYIFHQIRKYEIKDLAKTGKMRVGLKLSDEQKRACSFQFNKFYLNRFMKYVPCSVKHR